MKRLINSDPASIFDAGEESNAPGYFFNAAHVKLTWSVSQ
jgi:hypothetical protein